MLYPGTKPEPRYSNIDIKKVMPMIIPAKWIVSGYSIE